AHARAHYVGFARKRGQRVQRVSAFEQLAGTRLASAAPRVGYPHNSEETSMGQDDKQKQQQDQQRQQEQQRQQQKRDQAGNDASQDEHEDADEDSGKSQN